MFLLQNQNLGEQALNKIAELALANQFVRSQALEVNVATDPTLLAQGKLSSLLIRGVELELQSGLRVAQMDLKMGEITVDPLRALMGNINLVEPIQGTGQITLTAQNFTRALVTPKLKAQLKQLPDLEVDRVVASFSATGTINLALNYWTPLGGKQSSVVITEVLADGAEGGAIAISPLSTHQGEEPPAQLCQLLQSKVTQILNLHPFGLNGMTLQATGVAIREQQAEIQAAARMVKFPS